MYQALDKKPISNPEGIFRLLMCFREVGGRREESTAYTKIKPATSAWSVTHTLLNCSEKNNSVTQNGSHFASVTK